MKLTLGCAQFGMAYGIANKSSYLVGDDELAEILNKAFTSGIAYLDTASSYGSSESRLGAVIADRFKITTKLAKPPDYCDDHFSWAIREIEKSLKKLGVKALEAVLVHNSSDLLTVAGERIYDALNYAKDNGIVNKIGISVYSPEDFEKIVCGYDIDIVQAPVNIFDMRIIQDRYTKLMRLNKIELQARSVFLQGLLLMELKDIPVYFTPWMHHIKCWHENLKDAQIKPLSACMNFIRNIDVVENVVIGVQGLSQLHDLISEVEGVNDCFYTQLMPVDLESNLGLIDPRFWKI